MSETATPEPEPTGERAEPEEFWQERNALGLRPIAYPDTQVPGSHPDQRPCPTWCWVANQSVHDHDIDWRDPMIARHSTDINFKVVASRYRGWIDEVGENRDVFVRPATLEPHLEQRGQGFPGILVALRAADADGKPVYDPDRLRLSLKDAHELCVALRRLLDVADWSST